MDPLQDSQVARGKMKLTFENLVALSRELGFFVCSDCALFGSNRAQTGYNHV